MRVLHIGKFFPPYPGGIERATADLTAELAAHGVVTHVLAHAAPGTRTTLRMRHGDVDVTLAACHGQLVYAPLSPAFPQLLARTIAAFKPDLLHLHVPNTSALAALLLPRARRLPWIVHWHADVPPDAQRRALRIAYRVYRPWERALLKRAQAIVATSQPYLDASAALAEWRDKVRVIPLGVAPLGDMGPTPAPDWPAPGLRVLAVGRLSYYKGFDVLLRALALLPQASLVLVGQGECESDLRAAAQALGVAARVQFAGFVDDAQLAAYYANADVFCLPSLERTEAFGVVLLEAMRAGRALVASDVRGSGIGYVVRDGTNGLLATPGDARELAAALERLAGDAGLRAALGAAGAARWQAEFTLARAAQRTAALYVDVARAAGGKAVRAT